MERRIDCIALFDISLIFRVMSVCSPNIDVDEITVFYYNFG
jgi:hypothetical protein